MATTSDITLKASYFPAFHEAADMALYRQQAEWHLAPLGKGIEVEFPKTDIQAASAAKTADVVFFWQKQAFWAAGSHLRRKGLVVDEYAQQAVGDSLDAFVARYISPDYAGHSDSFFKAVKHKRLRIDKAIIIGSGPGISALTNLTPQDIETSLNLYLSTSILNEQACEACPPDIIIAVDGPSQFGLSETGGNYRNRAAELVRRYKSLILVPAQHLPSIRAHWPADIQDYVFAVRLTRRVKAGHRFSDDWQYEPTSNVLTSFGLPCAASFTDNISFAGISVSLDALEVNPQTLHWEHANESLYQRHVAPMLARHPASGQDNAGYLPRYHARLARELGAYAASGVSFSNVSGFPLKIKSRKISESPTQNLSFKVRFFEAVTKAEHYPEVVIVFVFILAGLLGTALQYSIGLDMMGFIIMGGLAACLVAGVLFLRVRMNRMTARLESKLSQQQAQQFANLSERLAALERKN